MSSRLGLRGYVRVLVALRDKPMTRSELVATGLIGKTAAQRLTRRMYHEGIIRVIGYKSTGLRVRSLPVFAYGPGNCVDADIPLPSAGALNVEVMAFASLMTELDFPTSVPDLQKKTGLYRRSIAATIDELRKAGMVRIAGWQSNRVRGGPPMRLWQLGSEPDVPRPSVNLRSARNARYRARLAANDSRARAHLEAA